MMDDERPSKRQRLDAPYGRPIPPDILLLSLPHFLAHPPTHRNHTQSLILSQTALRKYLALPQRDSISEFRALVELAEVGFRLGLSELGVESEVGRAISKALVIIAKHPSLRIYKVHVTNLSARLAAYQKNPKSAQNVLKKVLTNFLTPSDPPHIVYAAHISYISSLTTHCDPGDGAGVSTHLAALRANGNTKALIAIRELHDLAVKNSHQEVALLAMVLELRDLVQNGVWRRVGAALKATESALGMFNESPTSPVIKPELTTGGVRPVSTVTSTPPLTAQPEPRNSTALEHVLRIHVVIAGILYHTYVGAHADAHLRIKKMHEMLDGAAFEAFGAHGIVDVQLPNNNNGHNGKAGQTVSSPPLRIQVTHPRTLFSIGFLVSSVAKRDPTGRRPKRRQFAAEGVKVVDNELKKELSVPMWASIGDVHAFRERMNKIRADLICELIGVSIQRSEFDEAEHHISQLVAHVRTHGIFSAYCARLTLHQAHLAHALGRTERALKCYRVAAYLSRARSLDPPRSSATSKNTINKGSGDSNECDGDKNEEEDEDVGQEDYWINVSARAGDLWLRVGLAGQITEQDAWNRAMAPLRVEGKLLVKECEGLGGTLQAVGAVLGACLGEECVVVKTNLRSALQLCTTAEDNYLRPLVFALCADQYFHTSMEHAEMMLQTAEGLAAALGAQPKPKAVKGEDSPVKAGAGSAPLQATDKVGNAHLRMWIGERALELKRRAGDEQGSARQAAANDALRKAVVRLEKRKIEEVER